MLFGVDKQAVPGHDAVIVFFVMSGYVIAYVSERRDRPFSRFAIHRLARLWSVLVPALIVSLAVAMLVGDRTISDSAPAISAPLPFLSASLKTTFFLGESWWNDVAAPYNVPVWSLNFEAWYYVIFAAYTFTTARWRWPAAITAAVLAGPRIMPLFPCWLLGVWLYHHRHVVLSPVLSYALFGTCIVLYSFAYGFDLTLRSRHWLSVLTAGESYHLGPSTSVIGDLVLAPMIAASIFSLGGATALCNLFAKARPYTRLAASRTLSLYLFHMPVLVILYAGLGIGTSTAAGALLCATLGILGSVFLGSVSEARLPQWRTALLRLYMAISNRTKLPSG